MPYRTRWMTNKDRAKRGVFLCSNCMKEKPLSERVINHEQSHRCKACNARRVKSLDTKSFWELLQKVEETDYESNPEAIRQNSKEKESVS